MFTCFEDLENFVFFLLLLLFFKGGANYVMFVESMLPLIPFFLLLGSRAMSLFLWFGVSAATFLDLEDTLEFLCDTCV